ncbi:MAG: histidine kinase, partial [Chloroflexi bacterium]
MKSGNRPQQELADQDIRPESEAEKLYRLLAENVADIICTLDLDLRVTYLSPSVTHLLGYTVEEALGQRWDQWIDVALTPASADIATRVFREMVASVNQGQADVFKSWTTELEFNRADGSTLWTESKMGILRSRDGEPVGYIGVVRDIAERRRA